MGCDCSTFDPRQFVMYRFTVLLDPEVVDANKNPGPPAILVQGEVMARTDTQATNAALGRGWKAIFDANTGDNALTDAQIDSIADRIRIQITGGADRVVTCTAR